MTGTSTRTSTGGCHLSPWRRSPPLSFTPILSLAPSLDVVDGRSAMASCPRWFRSSVTARVRPFTLPLPSNTPIWHHYISATNTIEITTNTKKYRKRFYIITFSIHRPLYCLHFITPSPPYDGKSSSPSQQTTHPQIPTFSGNHPTNSLVLCYENAINSIK